MTLTVLVVVLQAITAILAVVLAGRTREHRPIAFFLCGALCADLIRWALAAWVPPPSPEGPLLTGLAHGAFHIDSALFLIWPAGLAGTALWIFLRRRAWVVIPVWAATVAALVVTYPTTRGAVLQKWYLAAELAALAVTLGAIIQWAWKREVPRFHHVALMLVAGVDVAALIAGPWRGVIYDTWPLSQFMSVVLYTVLITMHGGALWTSGLRRSS
jgi:hypothetical protein